MFGAGLGRGAAAARRGAAPVHARAAASAGVHDGHVAVEFVDSERITELNAEHRGKAEPTDVLSFPIDGAEPRRAATELPCRASSATW